VMCIPLSLGGMVTGESRGRLGPKEVGYLIAKMSPRSMASLKRWMER
jgi:hypothetical protein